MYGVILWSDPTVRKAVIWCEDHGDLAYYEAPERGVTGAEIFFDAGDYVEFDVTVDHQLKRARNAQTVMSCTQPVLSHTLDAPERDGDELPKKRSYDGATGHVIRLADRMPGSMGRQYGGSGEFSHRG